MDCERMARILFNMSLDMNYADCLEMAETEIAYLADELRKVKESGCDSLFQALEIISMQNESMEFWKDNL